MYLDGARDHPELHRFLPYGPFSDLAQLQDTMEDRLFRDPCSTLFAIIDKTRSQDEEIECDAASFAGSIGFLRASPENSSIEIAHILILPSFQHTHVGVNAIGLLLVYCLERPNEGGLGLRRVQWQAHAANVRSIGLAQKMGFKLEGYIRWQRVLKPGKEGDERTDGRGPGRSSAMLSICWDDWEQDGVKEAVFKAIDR
jgi:RimJ/RimL family protein N-acetyltransferase